MAIHESGCDGFLASGHFQPLHPNGVPDREAPLVQSMTRGRGQPSPEAASWVVRSPFVRVKAALPTFPALLAPPSMWAHHLIVGQFIG